MAKDQPVAGKTPAGKRGGKPQKLQVTVKTPTGTNLIKQTVDLFRKPKPAKATKAAAAQPAKPRKPNPMFDR